MLKVLVMALLALGSAAAQPLASPQSGRSASSPVIPNNLQLRAALKTKLESKKAKVGDKVKLKVLEEVRGSDGEVILPKGTELRGRVTLAVPFRSSSAPARISLVVESAQLKNGPETMSAFIAGGVELAEVEEADAKRKSTPAAGPGSVKCGSASFGCNPHDVGQWGNGPDVGGAPVEENVTWVPAEKAGVDVRLSPDPGVVSELTSAKGDFTLREDSRLKLRNFLR